VLIKIYIFLDVTSCMHLKVNRCFWRICRLHLQCWRLNQENNQKKAGSTTFYSRRHNCSILCFQISISMSSDRFICAPFLSLISETWKRTCLPRPFYPSSYNRNFIDIWSRVQTVEPLMPFLQPIVTSSFYGPNILPTRVFLKYLNVCSFRWI
jgi:hypothetical protein